MLLINIVGSSVFVHTHEIDGVVMAHSHPFAGKTHNHSTNQFVALHAAISTQSIITDTYEISNLEHQLIYIVYNRVNKELASPIVHGLNLRAPPCC